MKITQYLTTVTINIQKIRTNIKIEATNTKINTIKITLTDKNKQGIVGENVTVIIEDKQYNLTTKENGVIYTQHILLVLNETMY